MVDDLRLQDELVRNPNEPIVRRSQGRRHHIDAENLPESASISMTSPTRKGRSPKRKKPLMRFDSVVWAAKPTAT